MGLGQSVPIPGGGSEGYHILRVQENSPGQVAGLEPFFDFIVAIENTRLDQDNDTLKELLKAGVGKELKLIVYSSKTQTVRTVNITPSNSWGGQGLLGVSIRFCSFEGANENVWHILEVHPSSPAEEAGLIPFTDYIIGADSVLHESEDLFTLILAHEGRSLKLYVYNIDMDMCREVTITPNSSWPGEGSLGCGIGYGYLHRIPVRNVNSQVWQSKGEPLPQQLPSQQQTPSQSSSPPPAQIPPQGAQSPPLASGGIPPPPTLPPVSTHPDGLTQPNEGNPNESKALIHSVPHLHQTEGSANIPPPDFISPHSGIIQPSQVNWRPPHEVGSTQHLFPQLSNAPATSPQCTSTMSTAVPMPPTLKEIDSALAGKPLTTPLNLPGLPPITVSATIPETALSQINEILKQRSVSNVTTSYTSNNMEVSKPPEKGGIPTVQ